jgi:predicted lipoprotein with Yx(FWY)xxD motif
MTRDRPPLPSATAARISLTAAPGLLVFVIWAVVGLAACGSSGPTAKTYTLNVMDVPGPGYVLANRAGYALYVYIPDEQGRSRCTYACAEVWPPLLLPRGVGRPTAGKGVDAALLGTTRRENGSLQVTYNRWPLYTYLDDGRGQVTGQGGGMGAWYLISTTGSVDRVPPSNRAN